MGKFARDGKVYECNQYRETEVVEGQSGQEDLLVPEKGWIVESEDGKREVVENDEFQQTFVLAEERYL